MKKSKRKQTHELLSDSSESVVIVDADDTTCAVCYAEFLEPEDLEVHIKQVHPPGKLVSCQFCDGMYPDAEKYVLHLRDEHLAELNSCAYCTRVFTDMSMLKKHLRRHEQLTIKDSYGCSQCKLTFQSTYELTQHELTSHSDVDDGVFLYKYYALLSSVLNINADSVIQAIGKEFYYVCLQCKYSGTDLDSYLLHLQSYQCRSLACDKCYKVFSKRSTMVDHLAKNPDCQNIIKEPKKLQCRECLKFFAPKAFKQHNKSCKVLKCSSCQIVFESMYELSEHQNAEHPLAVALVLCKFCRKECVGKISLDKHIQRTHQHELHLYKYTCTYCDAIFKHPQRLFAHYFMKHKSVDPYLCKICNKQFRIRKQFTLHIKLVHSSIGFVEFDEKFHVFFTEKKSEKPFHPVSKYAADKTVVSNGNVKGSKVNASIGNKKDDDLEMVNVNSDFMNPTETEGNQTDANEDNSVSKHKRKRRTIQKKIEVTSLNLSEDCDSDEETLLEIKKKTRMKSQLRRKACQSYSNKKDSKLGTKQRFTCNICKKYCYTFQNYHNHVSMHFKDESKKCVKCSLSFKSKADLQRHLAVQHSSSKLTETLKNLLERRKQEQQNEPVTTTKKFLNTIKKVKCVTDDVTATLTPVKKELSVQNFIENFTPEANEIKSVRVENSVSFTKVSSFNHREPVIKMTKFTPAPVVHEKNIKLAMPVRFRKINEKHSVTIREVPQEEYRSTIKFQLDDESQSQDDMDNEFCSQEENKEACIPEVEQEVTLEGTEEAPRRNLATHRIIIPKLPKGLKSVRIAHLQPYAPFYKIVKMDDIMNAQAKETPKVEPEIVKKGAPVRLPDGTKLVHVNPLAHLLGGTPLNKLMSSTNKYYKAKPKNFEDALAKALLKLETPKKIVKKKTKIQDKVDEDGTAATAAIDEVDSTVEPAGVEAVEPAGLEAVQSCVEESMISDSDSMENVQIETERLEV